MGDKSRIEWTDASWNPVSGCTKVSQGCKHCYAERVFPRVYPGRAFTDVRFHSARLVQPLKWSRPRRIFVNSMSDLFHDEVTDAFIDRVFAVIGACDEERLGHVFQILTKRPERMREYMLQTRAYYAFNKHRLGRESFPPQNVWLGVSVEDQATADERIPLLLRTPAAVRWISAEPLLGPIDLRHRLGDCVFTGADPWATGGGLDWVVVGGESGPKARPMHPDWARSLRDQCVGAGVPFFFKQWGEWAPAQEHIDVFMSHWILPDGRMAPVDNDPDNFWDKPRSKLIGRVGKRRAGRLLDGREWNEYP